LISINGSIADAIYEAAMISSSRLHSHAAEHLGMTLPSTRRGGASEAIQYATGLSPLGQLLVATTGRGICAIALGADEDELLSDLRSHYKNATLQKSNSDGLRSTVMTVIATITEPNAAIHLPLDLRATAFQLRVWTALRQIARGQTRSYSEVAQTIGQPSAARAVAAACARNPVALAIPCHRVVGSSGALTGYHWGIDRKRALLAIEAVGK